MRVRLHDDAAGFLTCADPFIRSDPFSANVIAVVATGLLEERPPVIDECLWVSVEDRSGGVVGVAMHTPPHALFISRMPHAAAAAVADAVADAGRELPGISGAREAAGAFACAWSARTGQTSTLITAMRMYRLHELAIPQHVPGRAALATLGERELVADWLAAFHDEAQPHAPVDDWTAFATRRITSEQLHLWYDGTRAVSLAGVSAPAAGVARVGAVYTPPCSRRQGYGAAITARASAAALAAGAEHVVLYTDLANPVSNSVYQSIGYRADHDAEERLFR